ncbi:MAG: rhomboid family intramembrane serine protease [Acidobacteria bacterium]|nr:rhomboid family intramembrane serine protease [Acidobacteriota bacterium]
MRAFRRENLHSIYILLFLNIAFYVFQTQDVEKYVALFSLDRTSVLDGQLWRLFTYQFTQSSAISLFFSLLILYIMGAVLEELWGTWEFLAFYLLSLFGSAAVGMAFGFPLLGSYFLTYSLLFAYAHSFPEQTFLIFFVLPVKVKWIAWFAAGLLAIGIVTLRPPSIAALGGVLASFAWYWFRHGPARILPRKVPAAFRPAPVDSAHEGLADRNLARFAEMKRTLAEGTPEERQKLAESIGKDITPGVNICPPVDYKPEAEDRYCVRCEGFAECSVRFLKLNEPAAEDPAVEGEDNRKTLRHS